MNKHFSVLTYNKTLMIKNILEGDVETLSYASMHALEYGLCILMSNGTHWKLIDDSTLHMCKGLHSTLEEGMSILWHQSLINT